MAIRTTLSTPTTPPATARKYNVGELINGFNRWRSAYKTRRLEQAAINELASLSDRELKDIGLFRAEIDHIARNPAPRGGRRGATDASRSEDSRTPLRQR